MSSTTTLKSLSKEMKVSISTISKALNNSSEISEKTKRKIRRKAHELNYVPNNLARALRTRKTNMIAVIVPEISSVIYSKMLSRIQERVFEKGYRMVVLESFYSNETELECLNAINDGCVDGVVIIRENQMNRALEKPIKPNGVYGLDSIVLKVNGSATIGVDEYVLKKYFKKFMFKIEKSRK